MHHPERFPTPQSSPMMTAENRNGAVATDGQVARAEFTLQSSDSSDEDDDSPPPPYPGFATSQSVAADDVATDVTSNTIDLNQTNSSTNNVGVGSALQERDNSRQRDGVELPQTHGPSEETEMVIIV